MEKLEFNQFIELLKSIRKILNEYEVHNWPNIINKWIEEIEELRSGDGKAIVLYLQKIQRSLGGMGSLGDLVICPEAGHKILGNEKEIEKINDNYINFIRRLDNVITQLLQKTPKDIKNSD